MLYAERLVGTLENGYIEYPEVWNARRTRERFRAIPMDDARIDLLRKYFLAMAHLYWLIPLRDAFAIIEAQNPGVFTREELTAFAQVAMHADTDYCILGVEQLFEGEQETPFDARLIVYGFLLSEDADEELLPRIYAMQQGKPYYVPKRDVLLRYAKRGYIEPSASLRELRAFLMAYFAGDAAFVGKILEILAFLSKADEDLSEAIKLFLSAFPDEAPPNDKAVELFGGLYVNFHNNLQIPCNRGHSPRSLTALHTPEGAAPRSIELDEQTREAIRRGELDANDLRNIILRMELPNEALRQQLLRQLDETVATAQRPAQAGRNDPCPCGSGKIYKKCCGK